MAIVSAEAIRATGSFNLSFEAPRPLLVMEYVSPYSKRKDYKDSFKKYEEQLKVPYCLMFYPEKQGLRVYRHRRGRYRQLRPNAAGRYAIPDLGLEAGLLDDWVRFWYQGRLLEMPSELQPQIDAERQRADREKQRADAAEAEVARLRALLQQG